ncbi:MAG: carbohydrate kinase [Flavobacteriaceae bacterium]|nr:carbohydrate kinase [Flavobacteriaceae bacterium]
MPIVTCFGEVLWDMFPTHKKIGGAPLNVALRLQSFGVKTHIISRVGNDNNGKNLLQFISEYSLDTSLIQLDENHKTGCVQITLNKNGSASYEIEYPVAWDKIEVTDQIVKTVRSSDAFIFGSLASRDEITKNTLIDLLQYTNFKVFDLNLRPPFYTMGLLLDLMMKSDFIKCNDEELNEICTALNFKSKSIIKQIQFLSQKTQTKQICVTKGENGATLLYNDQLYNNNGYTVKVIDTVGAGDSFLATLISKLLYKTLPEEALDFACAVGALVASKEGANPKLVQSEILDFIKKSN